MKKSLGNDLLSQGAAPQVPSALISLTSGFGMLPGVPSSLESPRDKFLCQINPNIICKYNSVFLKKHRVLRTTFEALDH